jgi:PAS domain S-box-containing protein
MLFRTKIFKKSNTLDNSYRKQFEEQDEFRTVLYSIGDAVITTDLKGRIVRMNLIAEQLIGISESKAKGIDSKQLYSIVSEDEDTKFENPVDKALKEKIKVELSNSALLKLKNGKTIPISDSASPIINDSGEMVGVVLIFRDETENRRKKKLLQESENKFSTVFHSSPEAIIITSLDGVFIDVNSKFLEITGYKFSEVIGKTTRDLNFWINFDERKQLIDKIVREQKKQILEFDFRIKSGELRKGYLSTELIEIKKDKVLLSIIQDITERKQTELQIQASEQLFRALVENSPDFIARYDREFRRIYVNPAIQKLFENSPKEVLGKTPIDKSPLYAPQVYIDNLKQVIETAAETVAEIPFRTVSGEMHWGQMRFVPEYASDGNVDSVLAIGRDIHEIKENEQRFRMLAENFPDFVIRFDKKFRITYVNSAIEKAFNIPAEDLMSKTLYELPLFQKPEQNDLLQSYISRSFSEDISSIIEVRGNIHLGERIFEIRLVPEKDATENIISVLSILRDITERKLAEHELRIMSLALANIKQAAFLIDMDEGFRYVNEAACKSLGYTQTELLKLRLSDIDPGFGMVDKYENLKLIKQNKQPKFETFHRSKKGEVFPVEIFSAYFEYESEELVLSLVEDISERKKHESLLIESEKKYRTLAENYPDFIIGFDTEGRHTYVNASIEKAFSIKLENIIGKTIKDLFPGNDLSNEQLFNKVLEAVNTKQSNTSEIKWQTIDGERIIEIRHIPEIDANGNCLGVLGIGRDITERRIAEIDRQTHLWIMESLDKVNSAIQGCNDLDQMMKDVLDEVLSILNCDRAYLINPCDPKAKTWKCLIESTHSEYPGASALNIPIEMDYEMSTKFKLLLESNKPLTFGQGNQYPLLKDISERFNFQSLMAMALYPKSGMPWEFGIQQCSHSRVWTKDEERLIKEIGQRLADGLTSLLALNTLKESEERFRMLAENSRDVIFKMSLPDGEYEYVSPSVTQLTGYTINEFYNNPGLFKSILHPDFHDYFEEQWQNLLNGKLLPAYEYKIIHNSGTEHWCNLRSILSKDDNNIPIAIEGIVTDVTERKTAELALKELLTHNQSLLQLSKKLELASTYDEILDAALLSVNKTIGYNNLWIYLIDEDKEHCKVLVAKGSVSKKILSLAHIATLSIKGDRMLEEIVSQKEIVLVEDARIDERTNKEIVAQLENRTIVNVPIILFDRHLGSVGTGTFSNEGVKAPTKSEQEFLMALASHLAVSIDRVHLQQTKKEAEERIRKLSAGIEQSPASVVITDLSGNVEYVNKKFTEVTGYTSEEIIGKHTRLLKSGYTPTEEYKKMWETIINKKEWRGEFYNKKKNGELYWELASISPIINEVGEITNFLAIKEDITHIKKMTEELISARDKAEEMNRVKTYFYAQMSHELRTPFVGIFGFAELLKEKLNDSDEKEMAEAIYKSSKRLMDTLNKILDITKLEFDGLEPKFSNVDISKLLTSLKELYFVTAQKQNTFINIKLHVQSFLLKTDERLLTEILHNLISNAVKYTIDGLIEIKTDVATKNGNRFLIIKVSDNGIGIPEDKLEVIWDDFRQVSEGFNRTFEGTGLGLSITKKYVGLIGGKISVESKIDKGTTFTIELPCNETDCVDELITETSENVSVLKKPKSIKKAKILYVEDEGITLLYVTKLLSDYYEVDTAVNASLALEKINQNYYSALLLDINLGKGIDGVKLMQLTREIPFYKTIPIAALTAFASSSDKIEFLNKGFSHYLSKPFDSAKLLKLLENMLSNKQNTI